MYFICFITETVTELVPEIVEVQQVEDSDNEFNDLEVLQLIPIIVEQLRQGSVTEHEKDVLKSIFGELWSVVSAEAERKESDPVNSLLQVLYDSNEMKSNKRNSRFSNDVELNTIELKKSKSTSSKLSPADQLLHRIWSITSESILKQNNAEKEARYKMNKNQRKKLRRGPTNFKTDFEIDTFPEKPNRRYKRISTHNRKKRSFHITKSDDLAEMKALVKYLNAQDNNDTSEENIDFDFLGNSEITKPKSKSMPSIYELFYLAEKHRRRRHELAQG